MFKLSSLLGVVGFLLMVWYVVFECDWITYTGGAPSQERCYSPNREYYVVRLQSPFHALFTDSLYAEGTAKLYDKSGKQLYTAQTSLSSRDGPMWFDGFSGERPSVTYIGDLSSRWEWKTDLPSSPGRYPSEPQRSCF